MIKKVQAVYPSSNVSPDAKIAYGWRFARELGTRVNSQGQVVPSAEESASLRVLRARIDAVESIGFAVGGEVIQIEDFAVNYLQPAEPAQRLGLFVLSRPEAGQA